MADSSSSALRSVSHPSEERSTFIEFSHPTPNRPRLRVVSRGRMFTHASIIGLRGGAAGSSALTGRRSRRQLRRWLSGCCFVVTEASGRHNHRKPCNSQNRFLHNVSHCLLG